MRHFGTLIICLLLMSLGNTVLAQDELTPYEIALERILEAEATEATELDLYGLRLSEVPLEIGNLSNLQSLILAANQLSSLPLEIGNLSNLEILSLHSNRLSSLPPEIGNLDNLHLLSLSNNELSSLPPEIGNLSNLRALFIDDNRLSNLPSEIGSFTTLCILNLEDNQLRYLPSSLGQLHNLAVENCYDMNIGGLYIDGNPLISPPPEVVEQGTSAILDYLSNPVLWYVRKYSLWILSVVGLITTVFLGLRFNYRRNRKPKAKNH